jgi:ATP-dependent DNA ligase
MTLTLPWFPPAPAPGPASLLELPPDDWALEPKIDGIRVVWLEGRPFTRQGSLLSASKGADRLCQHLSAVEHTLDGEWVPARDEFYAFDLPDCPLSYDERRSALAKILGLVAGTEFDPPLSCTVPALALTASSPQVYEGLKGHGAEGVVLKRRRAVYAKHIRPGVESRDWLKRRFAWD